MLIIPEETLAEKEISQAEEKFFADLDKKIRASKWISCEVHANCEIFHLDKINVSFDICTIELVVTNKIGFETKMINCKSDPKSAAQQKKFSLFCELLALARSKNYAENKRREQKQQHNRKSCEVETIKAELTAVKRFKRHRQKLDIVRQSVRRFRGM